MTDNEIIKALECCYVKGKTCDNCPTNDFECLRLEEMVLELINRQKAEIERLTINMNAFGLGMKREAERADTARVEAINELVERIKEKTFYIGSWQELACVDVADIENIVNEMVGDSDV